MSTCACPNYDEADCCEDCGGMGCDSCQNSGAIGPEGWEFDETRWQFINPSCPLHGGTARLQDQGSPAQFYILYAGRVVGNCALWWQPDSAGYTTELDKAGLYTSCPTDRGTDVLVPKELAERLVVRHVRLDHLREHMDLSPRRKAS